MKGFVSFYKQQDLEHDSFFYLGASEVTSTKELDHDDDLP